MPTPYSVPIEIFLKKIEKDIDFFNYYEKTNEEVLALIQQRSLAYLNEAVDRISFECNPSVDFSDRDDNLKQFNFNFTANERVLVSSLMFESHLSRDIAYLKLQSVNYTPSELRVFDPSNARSTFLEMYKIVHEENKVLLEEYRSRNRITGEFVGIDYSVSNADGA